MPVIWKLKKVAAERNVYRPKQLQLLIKEKTGVALSLEAVCQLSNHTPKALRGRTAQLLCNALDCCLSDLYEIVPDAPGFCWQGTGSLQSGEDSLPDPDQFRSIIG